MKKMKKLLAVLTAGVMCAGMTAGAYVTAQEFPAVSDAAESTVMVQDDGETKVEGDFSYRVQEDGMIEILKYLGTSGVVKVPDTVEGMEVTRIGDEAFCYSTVETITIPDSITSIGQSAFYSSGLWENCSTTEVYVGNWLVGLKSSNSIIDDLVIADGTVGIADYVSRYSAYNYAKVNSVKIPEGVKYIGVRAFLGCKRLNSVTLPDTLISIGMGAFQESGLSSIIIPDGITSIPDYTFCGCSSLLDVKMPDSITNIGKYAFLDTALLSNQSTDMKYVGNWLVQGSYGENKLKEGTVGIADRAFNNGIYSVSVSGITMVSSLKYIGAEAFYDCESLKEVTLPKSIVSMGNGVFQNCSGLETVKFRSMEFSEIPDDTFSGCTSLNKITLSDTTTRIGKRAFENCSSLANITIPETVTQIDDAGVCRMPGF